MVLTLIRTVNEVSLDRRILHKPFIIVNDTGVDQFVQTLVF